MDQLVADGKFRQLSMFDYQAFTEGKKKDSSKNASSSLFNV